MIEPIHLIRFEGDPTTGMQIVFSAGYKPSIGPLPQLSYRLTGLWVHKGIVIRALFRAPTLPVHDREPILHRYEGPGISHPGQARYRYFSIPQYAGMILSNRGFAQAGIDVEEIFASLSALTNQKQFTHWQLATATWPHEELVQRHVVSIPDMLGAMSPITLIVRKKEEHSDAPAPPQDSHSVGADAPARSGS